MAVKNGALIFFVFIGAVFNAILFWLIVKRTPKVMQVYSRVKNLSLSQRIFVMQQITNLNE